MDSLLLTPAAITQSTPEQLALSGDWTARGLGAIGQQLDELSVSARLAMVVDGSRIVALDTAGAWVMQKLLRSLRGEAGVVRVSDLRPEFAGLLEVVGPQPVDQGVPAVSKRASTLEHLGRRAEAAAAQAIALLGFVADALFSVVFSALDL